MKYLTWLVLSVALTYAIAIATKGERRNYEALVDVWKASGNTFSIVEAECDRVAQTSADPQLRFVAQHLGRYADIFRASGYKTIGQVSTSSPWEAFGRGFVLGFQSPTTALKIIPLWWNSDEFDQSGTLLAERYGALRYYPAVAGVGIAGLLTFAIGAWLNARARTLTPAGRGSREIINVTST
jgi:hypothetical protein